MSRLERRKVTEVIRIQGRGKKKGYAGPTRATGNGCLDNRTMPSREIITWSQEREKEQTSINNETGKRT